MHQKRVLKMMKLTDAPEWFYGPGIFPLQPCVPVNVYHIAALILIPYVSAYILAVKFRLTLTLRLG